MFINLNTYIMKRTNPFTHQHRPYKKQRINKWVSPSNLSNFSNNDPVIDYFKAKRSTGSAFSTSNNNRPATYLQNQGILFENEVYQLLREQFPNDITNIDGSLRTPELQESGYKATIEAINKKVPIIYQGVLIDVKKYLRGIPELIVLGSFLHRFIKNPPDVNPNQYVVIDVKFSTLRLRSDGIHLLNSGSNPQYKSQLYMYTQMLNILTKQSQTKSFILGRRWSYVKQKIKYSGEYCFDKLAQVDFSDIDEHIPPDTREAIRWVRDCRKYHHRWTTVLENESNDVITIPRDELYPNMCKNTDPSTHEQKLKLANQIGEITMIWNCGPAARDKAHAIGIMSWFDTRLTAQIMDFQNEREQIINKILAINRQDKVKILPTKIPNNDNNWRSVPEQSFTERSSMNNEHIEFYIDFESESGVADDFRTFPRSQCNTTVFMANVGYTIMLNNQRYYKSRQFAATTLDKSGETEMFTQMANFVNQMSQLHNTTSPLLFHWGDYEVTQWNRVSGNIQMVGRWFNMHRFFLKEQITIKDCFGFSLKQVVPALYKHGLIQSNWNSCELGAGSSEIAVKRYRGNLDQETWDQFKDYNQTDTRVLWEIMLYLRTNM